MRPGTSQPSDSNGEIERLRRAVDAARQEARALRTEASTLRSGLASVKADLERIGSSRAWRWGHRATTLLSRARGRKPGTQGAVVAALERIAYVEQALGAADTTAAGSAVLPPGHAERVPQTSNAVVLGTEVRRRLGTPPHLTDAPLVSIVVVTRNGLELMRRLVDGLVRYTDYPRMELIVVDNGSSDATLEWLATIATPFEVRVQENADNEPFSRACNQGASDARGELLLFLNNDIELVESGWLRELVAAVDDETAAVGARLVHRDVTHPDPPSGWIIQHRGIRFERDGSGGTHARNAGDGEDAFGQGFGTNTSYPGATAACLLVRAEAFRSVGGFAEAYRWGTEDVDLGLRLVGAGWQVRTTGRAVVVHRESSTQIAQGREFKRLNRLANRTVFAQRWASALRREVRVDRLSGRRYWSEERPSIAITVTDADPGAGWGDWYTAHELGDALEERGWQVTYVERRGDRWYDLPHHVDYVLVLLDGFDARRVDPGIVTIAWIRNWTERWIERPWLDRIDVLLCSSDASSALVRESTGRSAETFPLATNPARFRAPADRLARPLDYVFTGNRWDEERAIERALKPRRGERIAIYGKGWENVPRLRGHARGSVAYEELPDIYGSAKVVVDDAARHTLPYAAVNARVFDALASGTPVVSNGAAGVRELFDADFPVWDSPESLRELLDGLLQNDARRREVVERYRTRVLGHHTYGHRARRLTELLAEFEQRLSFCIKIGAPSWDAARHWGDLHFANALTRELRRRGHRALVQVLTEWEAPVGHEYDVVLVLRGLSQYAPKPGQFNVLWNISHPDDLTASECDGYDLVCVASEPFATWLASQTATPVCHLEQATDPHVFHPDPRPEYAHELVLVANSRKVRRKVIADLLPTSRELAVYGSGWEGILDPRHVRGEHVANDTLRHVYSSAAIVLNDHWDDMRANGFVSNRLYDAVACGALVVSDHIDGIEKRFAGAVVTYETREQLHALVERFLSDPDERAARGAAGRAAVLAHGTFAHRVDALLEVVNDGLEQGAYRARIEPVRSSPAAAQPPRPR